jgi:ABC-type uncharacterized transport system auxiliary subunit
MKNYIYFFAVFMTLQSCITIKDNYPDIKFYSLTHEPASVLTYPKQDLSLLFLSLRISPEIDSRHLIGYTDGKLQRYFYHRWINDLNDLSSDYLINKISESSLFGKGVIKSSSIIIPDLILEGEILDAKASSNDNNKPESNYVEVKIRFSFIRRSAAGSERKIIFNKDYNEKALRSNYEVNTIAPAISKALTQISNKLIDDINQNLILMGKTK